MTIIRKYRFLTKSLFPVIILLLVMNAGCNADSVNSSQPTSQSGLSAARAAVLATLGATQKPKGSAAVTPNPLSPSVGLSATSGAPIVTAPNSQSGSNSMQWESPCNNSDGTLYGDKSSNTLTKVNTLLKSATSSDPTVTVTIGGGTVTAANGDAIDKATYMLNNVGNFDEELTFDHCAPYTTFQTSIDSTEQYVFNGSLKGSATMTTDNATSTTPVIAGKIENSGTIAVVDNTTCSGGGTLTLQISRQYSAETPSNIFTGENCHPAGTVSGTACRSTINCSVGGTCDNPILSGDGC